MSRITKYNEIFHIKNNKTSNLYKEAGGCSVSVILYKEQPILFQIWEERLLYQKNFKHLIKIFFDDEDTPFKKRADVVFFVMPNGGKGIAYL